MPNPGNIEPHKFKKGQSGNPKGRPKMPDLKDAVTSVLGEEKDGKTALDAILMKLRQLAANGNLKAAEMLLDRAYGKPKQGIEHTGKDGGEIAIKTITIEIPDDGKDE